jgi:uncharacterized protein YutE (UPF0331/DUF86 family)
MLDEDFIKIKIDIIQEELRRLLVFEKFTFEEIAGDFFKYNTLERLLEKIIIRAVDVNQHIIAQLADENTDVPADYRETFIELLNLTFIRKTSERRFLKASGLGMY